MHACSTYDCVTLVTHTQTDSLRPSVLLDQPTEVKMNVRSKLSTLSQQ